MPKIRPVIAQAGGPIIGYSFICPGCSQVLDHGFYHIFYTNHSQPDMNWTFNGDLDNPTFAPSLRNKEARPGFVCHLHVIDGKIDYCEDCTHPLSGIKRVEMEERE